MHHKLSSRWTVIVVVLILGCIWLSPNFIKYKKGSMLEKNRMTMGLDIQGGLHLVMGVDVQEVVQERVVRMVKNLNGEMKDNNIKTVSITSGGEDKTNIEIQVANVADKDAVMKLIQDHFATTLQVVQSTDSLIELRYFEARMLEMKKEVVNQAIEVIRNRIDEMGVAEPSIVAQGTDRILVQLPGIQDSARAKELINRTAKLDFRVVSNDVAFDKLEKMIKDAETNGKYKLGGEGGLLYSAYMKRLNADLESQIPKDTRLVFEKLDNAENLETGRRPYLIKTDSHLGGDLLEDASVRGDEFGRPEVVFSFSIEGRKQFAELTSKAAGGSIAIVLDDVVKSAPHVEREIDSDSARITLGQTRDHNAALNEASFIATSLRAGALPVGLEQLEERTVGPSLGSDAIHKAIIGSLAGTFAVFLFMLFYYHTAGIIADIALCMNIILTFAVLSSLGATLTLPGVAGIALTVGIAVDANVIIFERIREELRKGGNMMSALRDGFDNAFASIFDSNLTLVLTCLVLMYYGTGPVRGFAVSLTIGVVVSMFTAIFVSRTMLDTLVLKFGMKLLGGPKSNAKDAV